MILFCSSFFSLPLILCMAFPDQEICTESFFKPQQGLSMFFIFFSPWWNCGFSDINYSSRQFGLLWQAWVAFFACLQSAACMPASDWCLLLESWACGSALCLSSQPCSVITDPLPSNSETDKTQAVWALCWLWGSSFTSGVPKAKLRWGRQTPLPAFPLLLLEHFQLTGVQHLGLVPERLMTFHMHILTRSALPGMHTLRDCPCFAPSTAWRQQMELGSAACPETDKPPVMPPNGSAS